MVLVVSTTKREKKKKTYYLKAWPRGTRENKSIKVDCFLSNWLQLVSYDIWERTVWVYSFLCLPKTDADYHTSSLDATKLSKGKYQVESCQSPEWMASFYTSQGIFLRICSNVSRSFYFKGITFYKNNNFSFKSIIATCPQTFLKYILFYTHSHRVGTLLSKRELK